MTVPGLIIDSEDKKTLRKLAASTSDELSKLHKRHIDVPINGVVHRDSSNH